MNDGLGYPSDRILSSDLLAESPCSLRGYIDQIDQAGIEGWAVDLAQIHRPVTLSLAVDDCIVSTTITCLPRPDLAAVVGSEIQAGFFFGPRDVDRLREFLLVLPNGRVRIVGEDTALCLGAGSPPPSLAGLFGASPAGTSPWSPAFDLLLQFSDLQDAALDLVTRPLRPIAQREQGYVEAIAIDGDNIWLIGWMIRPASPIVPAVVVDRQKIPAALAVTCYERNDVTEPACGFVGVMQTAWRPSSASKPHIYMGDSADHLGMVRPLKLVTPGEFSALVTPILTRSHSGPVTAMKSLLNNSETWTVTSEGEWSAVRAAVDSCLLLPGFGALVEGWVLSPVKLVAGFALKIGTTILSCKAGDLFWRDRQDLADGKPGRRALLAQAGFVAAFRGSAGFEFDGGAVLKIVFDDGSSSNHAVTSAAIGRIGHSDGLDAVLAMYPHLSSEDFFPAFGGALRAEYRAKSRWAVPKHIETCRYAIVIALPDHMNDLLMMVSRLVQLGPSLPRDVGIVFIASQSEGAATVATLFTDVRNAIGMCCSLFCVRDTANAFYALPSVLSAVRAERFAFVAANLLLTPVGWTLMLAALAAAESRLCLFGARDAISAQDECEFSLRCFAWSRGALLAAMHGLEFRFGGVPDLADVVAGNPLDRFSDGAIVIDPVIMEPLQREIDLLRSDA